MRGNQYGAKVRELGAKGCRSKNGRTNAEFIQGFPKKGFLISGVSQFPNSILVRGVEKWTCFLHWKLKMMAGLILHGPKISPRELLSPVLLRNVLHH